MKRGLRRDTQAGFSLVEILVVLAILGVLSGLTVISLGAVDRGGRPETEAQLFANRLSLALDEALVTGEPLRLVLDDDGYSIEKQAPNGEWVAHSNPLFGKHHALARDIRLKHDGNRGRLALMPDGTGDAFAVDFVNAQGGWRVSDDGLSVNAAPVGP